jgi:hypothetical protein
MLDIPLNKFMFDIPVNKFKSDKLLEIYKISWATKTPNYPTIYWMDNEWIMQSNNMIDINLITDDLLENGTRFNIWDREFLFKWIWHMDITKCSIHWDIRWDLCYITIKF